MQLSRLSLAVCLWSVCAPIGLSVLPASAQSLPLAGALTPAQGTAAALDRAHQTKTLTALNPCLTKQTAAFLGFSLVLAGASISGLTPAPSPRGPSPQTAAEKAFQDKVAALMRRYSLTEKALNAADKSEILPSGLASRGHQFLADALALKEAYEKNPAPGKSKILGDKFSGSDFPTSKECTFHVLSPTRVLVVPRSSSMGPIEARLEDGQWRVDIEMEEEIPDSSEPEMQTITPQAAAFIKAVTDDNAAVVTQMLKATPALANTRPSFYKGQTGKVSDLPLSIAAFHDNVQIATLLLHAGAKVNAENYFEETALDQAAFFGGAALVTLLLAHGANVAHRNDFGKTALHQSVEGDHPDIIAVLLAHGADVNARDNDGETPLTLALDPTHQGLYHAAVIQLLRRHGARK